MSRLLILTIGPFAIMTVAYWVAAPRTSAAAIHSAATAGRRVAVEPQRVVSPDLSVRCRISAQRLKEALPDNFRIVIRAPLLIAGDLPESTLQKLHGDVIGPVSRALRETYFHEVPRDPITIVICSTEDLFRQLAHDWDGHLDAGYHGYYQRDKRRILLDLEAGNGSLAHELTHALSHADCEQLPEWFDEGLGGLHEEAAFSADGKRLIGLNNWRCKLTRQAEKSGRLPRFEALTDPTTFRSGDVGLNYAVARSVCLFLQDRGLLEKYYQELRTRWPSDPNGLSTLCQVLGAKSPTQVERQFATWVKRRAG